MKMEGARTKRVIINADDCGFSPVVTEGILRAHRNGLVTSTTLMANMPSAASAAAKLTEVPQLGVGVHLNASQGPVLSDKGQALVGADGAMDRSAAGVILACVARPALLEAIEAEFDAQIRWVLDHGIRPTHLDTHRHAHAWGPVFSRVLRLARRYDIPWIRRYTEVLPGGRWPACDRLQRRVSHICTALGRVNECWSGRPDELVTRGTWGIAHTGGITRNWLMRAANELRDGVTEIMTHPGMHQDSNETPTGSRLGQQRSAEREALCDDRVRDEFERHGIERIHYGHLRSG
jgi:predicted glycoside hydrolase/deacetylase ChbG (UPF0249 family)